MNPLSWIGDIFGGISSISSAINGLTAAISNEKIAAINAKTDQEKAEIGERIAGLQLQRDVLIEDAKHSKSDIYMRNLFACCALIPVAKVLVWDKVIGVFFGCQGVAGNAARCLIFNTDRFSTLDVQIIMTCVAFYFVTSLTNLLKK